MLDQIFDVENRFWTFANKLADIVILELIWIVTSLPIITIGASSTAFWHMLLLIAEDEEGNILRGYFRAFRQNLKLGTKLWLSQLGLFLFLVLDIALCMKMGGAVAGFLLGTFGILGVMWLFASMLLYPLAGRYDFSYGKIMADSLVLGIRHLPHTLCMILAMAAAFAGSYFIPYVVIFLPPLAFLLNAKLCLYIFSVYTQDEPEDGADEGEAGEWLTAGAEEGAAEGQTEAQTEGAAEGHTETAAE